MVHDEGPAALPFVRQTVDALFHALNQQIDITNMKLPNSPYPTILRYLHKFITFIAYHPVLEKASPYDRAHHRREFKAYLLAMITQVEESVRYAAQLPSNTIYNPPSSYMKWVRTISAALVGGFNCGSMFFCYLSPGTTDLFPTPELKFIAQDCLTHLSTLCRMWNDHGSIQRDMAEENINSVHYPEFAGLSEDEAKGQLRQLAVYEKKKMDDSLRELRTRAKEVMGPRKGEAVVDQYMLFFRGAESYNAIYEFKTISGTKVSSASGALSPLEASACTNVVGVAHHQAPSAQDMHHHPARTAVASSIPPDTILATPTTHQIPRIDPLMDKIPLKMLPSSSGARARSVRNETVR